MNGRVAAVLALSLAAACGGGEPQNEVDPQAAPGVASPGTTTDERVPDESDAAPVTNIERPEQTMAAGTLAPMNNSGVGGSVNFRGIGQQTEVALQVTTVPPGTKALNAAVVQGTCERVGTQVAPVGPLTVGAGNIAALTDTLNLPPGTVLNGQHAIVVMGQNAGPATPPLACSPLPKWERLAPTG